MNQKLRTARNGILVLVAILCIVCLSLSLIFSANFAAYAEDGDSAAKLPEVSAIDGSHLWLMKYADKNGETAPLWSGINDGKALKYLDSTGDGIGVCTGAAADIDCFAPYRGVAVSIALNPDYKIAADKTLADAYDLANAVYGGQNDMVGDKSGSIDVSTSVTVPALDGGAELNIVKKWKVATLCNTLDFDGAYIGNYAFAQPSQKYDLLNPVLPADVVYHFSSETNPEIIFAVSYGGSILQAFESGNGYEVSSEAFVPATDEAINAEGGVLNYIIRNLKADDWTLRVAAMTPNSADENGIYTDGWFYGIGINTYKFTVSQQDISGDNFVDLFGTTNPALIGPSPEYKEVIDEENPWQPTIELKLGTVALTQGQDYIVMLSDVNAGLVDVIISGVGNLKGEYTVKGALTIKQSDNEWDTLPSINAWNYGDYDKDFNVITAMPVFYDKLDDITFRIVKIDVENENEKESALDGLSAIHFVRPAGDETDDNLTVENEIAALLAALHAGKYRLYVSVSGAGNYKPLAEKSVTFYVGIGNNGWPKDAPLSIVSWTEGKYNPEINTIIAVDRFGNKADIIIRNGKGEIVYSSHEAHKDEAFGNIDVLKKLKAGSYTLEAEIKGTDDYTKIESMIRFEIARNGLPGWAVAIIVVASLGVVALVFGILHQKGVLQMLTGKVIVSMRTRANVDATLAAIRAAKVAREAEASIAAAKAREAEEAAANAKKADDGKSKK